MATSFYKAQSAKATCAHHNKEQIDLFCKTCHKRICVKCAKGRHKDHDWTTINNEANEIKRNASLWKEKIRQHLAEIKQASSKSEVQDNVRRVRRMEKAMKDFIGQHADKLVKKLESGDPKKDMSKEIKALEQMLDFFEEEIKTAPDNFIAEVEEDIMDIISPSKSSVSKATERRMRYIKGKIVPESLEFMMGEVKEEAASTTGDQSHVSVTEVSSITHGTEFIRTINLISDVEGWIHSTKSTINEKVNKDGKKISEMTVGKGCDDFTVIDNDHVYTQFGNKMIRRVSSPGVITDITSTSPLYPRGICAARAGGLLVCLCSGDTDEINQDSYGEVHHLDMNGKLLRKYPDQGDGEAKLFTNPYRIAQNINLELCVVDIIATDFTSRLVVVAVNGKKRFKYRGQKSLKERFDSPDVVCDLQGRIILSDYQNDAIHLLTADGEFVQLLLTERSTLRYPRCLAVRGDKLWVGCDEGVIKVYQYNI